MRELEKFVSSNGSSMEENDPLQKAIKDTFSSKKNERQKRLDSINNQIEELRTVLKKTFKPDEVKETDKKETMTGVREYFSFGNKEHNLYIVLGVGLALALLCLYIYRRCN